LELKKLRTDYHPQPWVLGSFPTEEQAAQAYLAAQQPSRFPTSVAGFLLRPHPLPGQSKYLGVNLRSDLVSFQVMIFENNAYRCIGVFSNEETAALAYLKEHLKKHVLLDG
jgi:hypothetical protein